MLPGSGVEADDVLAHFQSSICFHKKGVPRLCAARIGGGSGIMNHES